MKKKRKKKKLSIRRIIFLGIILYVVTILINQNRLMSDLEGKKNLLTNEIHILEDEIEELNDELENSDSLEFVEKVAREELGMVKPREIIVIDEGKTKDSFFNLFKRDSNWHIGDSDIYWDWKYY